MRYFILIPTTLALMGCTEPPKDYRLDVKCRCDCPTDAGSIQEKAQQIPEILLA